MNQLLLLQKHFGVPTLGMPKITSTSPKLTKEMQELESVMKDFAKYYGIPEVHGVVPVYQKQIEELGETRIEPRGPNEYGVSIYLNPKIFEPYAKALGLDKITMYHEFAHVVSVPLLPYMSDITDGEKKCILEMLATYGLAKYMAEKGEIPLAINIMNTNPYRKESFSGFLIDKYYISKDHPKDGLYEKYVGLKGFLHDMKIYGARHTLDRFYKILEVKQNRD